MSPRQSPSLDLPVYQHLLVLAFEDLITATLSPAAVVVEMLDHTAISPQKNATPRPTGCLLFVEVANNDLKVVDIKLSLCKHKIAPYCTAFESANDERSMERRWAARKGNIIRITVGSRRPIGLIEDTVVKFSS